MALHQYIAGDLKTIEETVTETENSNGCFDCNICLDFAHDPVVTLCGHLYCWPCIYKWLLVQHDSLTTAERPQCPVCKAVISNSTMVPLYGRGHSTAEGKTSCDVLIPPRPPASCAQVLVAAPPRRGQRLPYRNPYQGHYFSSRPYQEEDATPQTLSLGSHHYPVTGMFGEMIYSRVFGNPENLYAYPNSYQFMGSSTTRLRRQEMQAHKSLNRISIFLFCCFLICLLVF
ncbi:E3 ubiquitin-protein ligase RMA1H1-like [Vigna umbellata]|uniref:E3 ubiquitin-protein ligase RMA1H1-like n=1 Tax=Vigna umbellata TaxID=87088 RepID=UPI001F5F5C7C|nr:E3 ubiquitin-protein ligase RMA1H1-like [Vigna umbellata]XP_047174921.1 E3 ubiquitin-protein ligase RMA1H1-like [Vigna umbellata]